ncbi:MAG: ABC transporter permease [Haloferacaceae archaeon]
MLEITRYETRRRARGTLALALLLGVFVLVIVSIYPGIAESSAEIDALIESLPESFREGFGAESYTTIEGFVSGEFYQFVLVLLLGLYATYAAAGSLAGDVDSGRLYLVLATPVGRSQLVVEKLLALLAQMTALNLLLPLFVFGATVAIDYPLDPAYVVAVHALALPYLFVCLGVGLLLSAVVSRGDVAQRGGIALVFLLFVLDAVTVGTDFEWLGAVSPTRYYDPTEILLDETLDLGDTLLLVAAGAALVLATLALFKRRDV